VKWLLGAVLVAAGQVASFQIAIAQAPASVVEVREAWARGTVGGQRGTGAFMQLTAPQGATLLGVESPVAEIVELHEMAMDGNVMRMRAIDRLALPAGRTVELKPGGYHVMLINLKAPLKPGESFPLRLRIEGADKKPGVIDVKVDVRTLTGQPAPKH
jgi:periplasmic copper chaperone A